MHFSFIERKELSDGKSIGKFCHKDCEVAFLSVNMFDVSRNFTNIKSIL